MRSASTARRGFSVLAFSINATIWAKRVSRPKRCTPISTGPARLKLPATTDSPLERVTG
jgi:hypothetical protein